MKEAVNIHVWLPGDIYRAVMARAKSAGETLSATVRDLLRRGLER